MVRFIRRNLFLLALLLSFSSEGAQIAVLSDLDDTIKQTHVMDQRASIHRTLFSTLAFSEMSPLFGSWKEKQDAVFSVLTATPEFFRPMADKFLRRNKFPHTHLIMKVNLFEGKKEYKTREVSRKIQEWDALGIREVILLGDDTQIDSDAYEEVEKQFPHISFRVYIRIIGGAEIKKHHTGFRTGLEIAIREYQNQVLQKQDVIEIAEKMLSEKKVGSFFPFFQVCPTDSNWANETISEDAELKVLEKQVRSRIALECLGRV